MFVSGQSCLGVKKTGDSAARQLCLSCQTIYQSVRRQRRSPNMIPSRLAPERKTPQRFTSGATTDPAAARNEKRSLADKLSPPLTTATKKQSLADKLSPPLTTATEKPSIKNRLVPERFLPPHPETLEKNRTHDEEKAPQAT